MRKTIVLGALLLGACSAAKAPEQQPAAAAPATNILHIDWGGIAYPDGDELKRHWSNYTINLIDGSEAYGWTSEKDISFPHTLAFELAGAGKITGLALDSTFAPVTREDGSSSSTADGSPVRHFRVMGSTASPDGPWFEIYRGEAAQGKRSDFTLKAPVTARWVRLMIDDNWAAGGQTRLSEFELHGALAERGAGGVPDVTGYYTHEYGPIVLKQDGHLIHGCYNGGDGQLEGMIYGRIMRLAWYMPKEKSIGTATLVAGNGQLYGFWYRDMGRMGSPWNATKVDPGKRDLGPCGALLRR
ncbi:discoidin domain-containing protein [Sphingomonas sp. AR_OL41]|uniref:discoidin domain-containing protein n=1 Tax=Sphingomonas sp. AR_OL41 TaxID=3042729 RepID=UPI0024806C6F|nr:discoidin domain-containing protein [Sphingomonas sp. AR_OL41]MDH7972082.1 discoidin domain-containing protein [Sphingomonas sp. AR_OL41]